MAGVRGPASYPCRAGKLAVAALVAVVLSLGTASAQGTSEESVSKCSKKCFDAAQKLGNKQVVDNALACFIRDNEKRMGFGDCCNKAEGMFMKGGPLSECLCCPEYAKAFFATVPYNKLNIKPNEYVDRLLLCRVPMYKVQGLANCPARNPVPFERAAQTGNRPGAGPEVPRLTALSSKGLLNWIGYNSELDVPTLIAQGQALIANGTRSQVNVVGASQTYNEYMTGYIYYIEQTVPAYDVPKFQPLPPLPDQFKADVAWVASLRRGPYPDVIIGRPAAISPKRTDPLQNGQISNLSPGPAFFGQFPRSSPAPSSG